MLQVKKAGGALFQHTAARRRLPAFKASDTRSMTFQHTAARRRLRENMDDMTMHEWVSTHSRPKAAALPLQHT